MASYEKGQERLQKLWQELMLDVSDNSEDDRDYKPADLKDSDSSEIVAPPPKRRNLSQNFIPSASGHATPPIVPIMVNKILRALLKKLLHNIQTRIMMT